MYLHITKTYGVTIIVKTLLQYNFKSSKNSEKSVKTLRISSTPCILIVHADIADSEYYIVHSFSVLVLEISFVLV